MLPGIASLYRGVGGAASGAGIYIGTYFAFYGAACNLLARHTDMAAGSVAFVAGAAAAAGGSVVKVPLAVCIRSVQAGVYPNVVDAASSIVRAAGARPRPLHTLRASMHEPTGCCERATRRRPPFAEPACAPVPTSGAAHGGGRARARRARDVHGVLADAAGGRAGHGVQVCRVRVHARPAPPPLPRAPCQRSGGHLINTTHETLFLWVFLQMGI